MLRQKKRKQHRNERTLRQKKRKQCRDERTLRQKKTEAASQTMTPPRQRPVCLAARPAPVTRPHDGAPLVLPTAYRFKKSAKKFISAWPPSRKALTLHPQAEDRTNETLSVISHGAFPGTHRRGTRSFHCAHSLVQRFHLTHTYIRPPRLLPPCHTRQQVHCVWQSTYPPVKPQKSCFLS